MHRVRSVEDIDQAQRERDLRRVATLSTERFFTSPVRSLREIRLVENGIFEVVAADGTRFALRVHRHGFRTESQIDSELTWMAHLAAEGTSLARPVPGKDGRFVQSVWDQETGVFRLCSMMSWIDGFQLDGLSPHEGLPMLGESLARMHVATGSFVPPPAFDRPTWDVDGLVGPAAVLGDYRNIQMSPAERVLFDRAADVIAGAALDYGTSPDRYGMIHGDRLENNTMVEGGTCMVIDFDDCGWGWYVFDLVTVRYQGTYVFDDPTWVEFLLSGYRSVRQLTDDDLKIAPIFLAARTLALVGWVESRGSLAARYRERCIAIATRHCRLIVDESHQV